MQNMFSPISLVDICLNCVITEKYVYFDNDPFTINKIKRRNTLKKNQTKVI
jgi:hypothetical protein